MGTNAKYPFMRGPAIQAGAPGISRPGDMVVHLSSLFHSVQLQTLGEERRSWVTWYREEGACTRTDHLATDVDDEDEDESDETVEDELESTVDPEDELETARPSVDPET